MKQRNRVALLALVMGLLPVAANAVDLRSQYRLEVVRNMAGQVISSNSSSYADLVSINNKGHIAGNLVNNGTYAGAFWASENSDGKWNVVNLPFLDARGGNYNRVNALNDNDQMVGYSTEWASSSNSKQHAAEWSLLSDGHFLTTSLHQGNFQNTSTASDINNLGQAIGSSFPPGVLSPTMLTAGFNPTPTNPVPTEGWAIANNDMYAGLTKIGGSSRGFIVDHNGIHTDIGIFGKAATAINDNGLATFFDSIDYNNNHVAYDLRSAAVLKAGVEGAITHAMGSNASSSIVGQSFVNNRGHAFLTQNEETWDLDQIFSTGAGQPGWSHLEAATDINDRGVIIGTGTYLDTNHRTIDKAIFVLTPVPEPQTYAMLLAGLAVVGWRARSRRRG